jgi:hypothetical protein
MKNDRMFQCSVIESLNNRIEDAVSATDNILQKQRSDATTTTTPFVVGSLFQRSSLLRIGSDFSSTKHQQNHDMR